MAEFSARQVVIIAAIAGALVGGVVAGVAVAVSRNDNSTISSSGDSSQIATAAVVRTNLTNTVQVGGSIGYDGSYTVAALRRGGGVYTWLPEPGQVISQDQPVYSVGNEPVALLYGSSRLPAFYAGMSDGADVGQLTHDLIALGYGDGLAQKATTTRRPPPAGSTLADSARPGQATGDDPARAKRSSSSPGPIRVTSVTPTLGTSVGGAGAAVAPRVPTATSTTPIVAVDLDVTEEYLVKPGDAVRSCFPTAPRRWGVISRRSATWLPARVGAASAPEAAPRFCRPVAMLVQWVRHTLDARR